MPADLDQLLEASSRTFALTIPFLPEPVRREVTVAYLLFRIADTLEDGERWPREQRVAFLRRFDALLVERPPAASIEAFAEAVRTCPPSDHPGYRALLDATPEVFAALQALLAPARAVVVRHLLVTVRGMAEGLEQGTGEGDLLRLRSLGQLQRYCYLVAGVVGEMLTELFLLHAEAQRPSPAASLSALAATLRAHARAFGEGLQLTNILKDRGDDARAERHFLPEAVDLRALFALARSDLRDAARYVGALATARLPEGLVAFTALPVRLALDTLQAVEARGAGAKVGREQLQLALEEVGQLVRGEKALEAVLRTAA
jgi:farnesyl-diphosphate farnesyltransferase